MGLAGDSRTRVPRRAVCLSGSELRTSQGTPWCNSAKARPLHVSRDIAYSRSQAASRALPRWRRSPRERPCGREACTGTPFLPGPPPCWFASCPGEAGLTCTSSRPQKGLLRSFRFPLARGGYGTGSDDEGRPPNGRTNEVTTAPIRRLEKIGPAPEETRG
jgi:hypothetical protein